MDAAWAEFDSFEEGVKRTPSIYIFSDSEIFTAIAEPSASDDICQKQIHDRTRIGNCITKAYRLPPAYIENITSTAVPWLLHSGKRVRWLIEIKLKPSSENLANRVINNEVLPKHEEALGIKEHRLPGGSYQVFEGVKLVVYKTNLSTQSGAPKGLNLWITTARHLPNIRGIPGVFIDPESEASNVFEGNMYNFDTGKICLSNQLHRSKIMALFQALFDAHYRVDPRGNPKPEVLAIGNSYKNAANAWDTPEIVPTGLVYITVGFDSAPSSLFNYIPFPKGNSSRIKWRHSEPPKCEYLNPDVPLPKTPPKAKGEKKGTHRGKKNPFAPSEVAKRASREAEPQREDTSMKPCREFNLGTCDRGKDCWYSHVMVDRDNFLCHKARCNQKHCRFLHEVSSSSRGRGRGKGKGKDSSSESSSSNTAGTGRWPDSRPSLVASEKNAIPATGWPPGTTATTARDSPPKRGRNEFEALANPRWADQEDPTSEEETLLDLQEEEAAASDKNMTPAQMGYAMAQEDDDLASIAEGDEPMPEEGSTQMPEEGSSQNLFTDLEF